MERDRDHSHLLSVAGKGISLAAGGKLRQFSHQLRVEAGDAAALRHGRRLNFAAADFLSWFARSCVSKVAGSSSG